MFPRERSTNGSFGGSYASRTNNVLNGGGLNTGPVIPGFHVVDDTSADAVYGEADEDFFWMDLTQDISPDRVLTEVQSRCSLSRINMRNQHDPRGSSLLGVGSFLGEGSVAELSPIFADQIADRAAWVTRFTGGRPLGLRGAWDHLIVDACIDVVADKFSRRGDGSFRPSGVSSWRMMNVSKELLFGCDPVAFPIVIRYFRSVLSCHGNALGLGVACQDAFNSIF